MRIALDDSDMAFAEEMRRFLLVHIPEEIRRKGEHGTPFNREEFVTTQQILNAHGLGVPGWPVEWGGRDWTPMQQYLWSEEMATARLPMIPVNTNLAGPVIAAFATEELKQRFLPQTANLDIWWCQGFSEPNAGSDLASVKTSAVRDGGEFVVNGQKIWTTQGDLADWMFCLVRTDTTASKPQLGLSFLLFDMKSPGVTVRPIGLIDGSFEVCEIFLDNVRVPTDQLVGEENRGWSYAKYVLDRERTWSAETGLIKSRILRLKKIAAETKWFGQPVLANPWFLDRLTRLEIEAVALDMSVLRVLASQTKDPMKTDPVSSILKLCGSLLQQEASELLMDLVGPQGLAYRESPEVGRGFAPLSEGAVDAVPTYFNWRKASIYGGSTEIQRMIIAKSNLGF